jgi:hypothetical protein
MSDTMINMELVYADLLTPGQLMEGDLIEIDLDIVEVISIKDDSSGDNYEVTYRNDFGEQDIFTCTYEHVFKLYVMIESYSE